MGVGAFLAFRSSFARTMRIHLSLVTVALAVSACGTPRPAAPTPGAPVGQTVAAAQVRSARDLVRMAQAMHSERFYRSLTFRQTTTFYGEQGTRSETWIEALELPGLLRIDLPEPGQGNVVIYRGDSTYVYREGTQVVARPGGNPLLQLGFDLYWLPPMRALAYMADAGIDTSVVTENAHAGRPAWVIGARPGDTTSAQVWYDRERLVFLRLIQNDGEEVTDIRFEGYEPLAGGWIAPRVEIYSDGVLVMTEDYHDLRTAVDLPAGTFTPTGAPAVHWWE